RHGVRPLEMAGGDLERVQHAFDDAVLLHEYLAGFHSSSADGADRYRERSLPMAPATRAGASSGEKWRVSAITSSVAPGIEPRRRSPTAVLIHGSRPPQTMDTGCVMSGSRAPSSITVESIMTRS